MTDWWARGKEPLLQDEAEVDTADLADDAVETAKLAALNVTSEKISANALRRSIVIPLPDLAAGTTAPLTSDYEVWTPSRAVVVQAARLNPLTSWVLTTVQSTVVGTLYAGADDIGTVVIPTTNAPVRGSQLAFSVAAAVSVAAGQALTFGLPTATSNGMDAPAHSLQIDYTSTE